MTDSTSIGEQLRVSRERVGLDQSQVAERMHVGVEVIDALETGKFKTLGAPVFVQGHLRHYAELLGEPQEELQSQYQALQEAGDSPDLTAGPHLPTHATRGPRARWPLIVFAIVLLVAVAVWWAMGVETT